MVLFIVRFWNEAEGKEFVDGIKQRISTPSYTKSWITTKVTTVGKNTVFEFTPEIPKFHYFLFIVAFFMYLIGTPVWAIGIPVYLGLLVMLFWSSAPYLLMMVIGFKKQFGHYPNAELVVRKQFIKKVVGWE